MDKQIKEKQVLWSPAIPSGVRLSRRIRVQLARFFRKISGESLTGKELSENEKTAIRIFEKCVAREDSELLMAPLSDTFYVKTGEIYLILLNQELRIINGKYSYDFPLASGPCERMRKRFRITLEQRRKKMEEKIVAKTKKSLQDILNEVCDLSNVESKM